MKNWLVIGGGLLVVFVAVVFFLLSSLDGFVAEGIETYGSEATKTKVVVNETEISPISGKVALRGLKIGNPEIFKNENAFELGEISLIIDVATIADPTVVIKELNILGPVVTYEANRNESNFDIIQENVDSYRNSIENSFEEGAASQDNKNGGREEEVKVIIEKLYIRNSKVSVTTPQISQPMIVNLSTLEILNIGKDQGGATPGQAVREILAALRQNVVKAVTVVKLDDAEEIIRGTTSEIRDQIENGTDAGLGGKVKGFFGN
jgi:hypothetical protein